MAQHTLKTIKPFFEDLIDGSKTFELRKNDRNFSVGDVLILKETWDRGGVETGRTAYFDVTYILFDNTVVPGLKKGWVIMGVRRREDA
jgi:ParB family chromosome partitioning protein